MNIVNTQSTTNEQPVNLAQAKLTETPIAICINGISQAVMMASPTDLEDFAVGFVIGEGLIERASDVKNISIIHLQQGIEVGLTVLARTEHHIKSKRRQLSGSTGCGLCGVDSIDTAMTLPVLKPTTQVPPSRETIEQAREALTSIQKNHGCIQGHHSAVYFDINGQFIAIREDVGRHSALDKLVGHTHRHEFKPSNIDSSYGGFLLMTSRCSHDLVVKAARGKFNVLITLAQPTNLAVASAQSIGLTLFCFVHGKLQRFS